MGICHFFLRGYCKFGDRCRFEHPNDMDAYADYQTESRNSRHQYNRVYENNRSYQVDRGHQSYRGHHQTDQEQRHQQSFSFQQEQKNQGHGYDQNRGYWQDQGYKQGRDYAQNNNQQGYQSDRGDRRFQDGRQSQRFTNVQDFRSQDRHEILQWLADDVALWKVSGQWPYSCYGPLPLRPCLSYFNDVSAEEIRWDYYKSRETNDFQGHLGRLECLKSNVQENMALLEHQGNSMITIMEKLETGHVFQPPQYDVFTRHTGPEVPDFQNTHSAEIFPEQSIPNSFSVPNPDTSFRFTLSSDPVPPQMPSLASTASSSHVPVSSGTYRSMDELSSEELTAFQADEFQLGCIPIEPPPLELCNIK